MKLIAIAFLLTVSVSEAQTIWIFEIFGGSAHSFSTSLRIGQTGEGDLEFDANYETRPFRDSPYYAWRVSRADANGAWEVELIHHKLHLRNGPVEIQHFEITHGYNLLLINRAWRLPSLILRAGGGFMIAHAETSVRGMFAAPGYELTGPTAQFAAEKRWHFSKRFFVGIEGKLTVARAKVSIANGHADAPNVAIHGLIGIGYEFK